METDQGDRYNDRWADEQEPVTDEKAKKVLKGVKSTHMHHLSQSVLLLKHWNKRVQTSCQSLTKDEEECEVESEEDLGDAVNRGLICYHCDNDRVCNEKLNYHIEKRED